MKLKYNYLLLVTLLFSTISAVRVNAQISVGSDGLYYEESGKPYTGVYIEKYGDGTPKVSIAVNKGRKKGLTLLYYPNGSVNELRMYNDNKMHGTWVTWNEKGVKTAEANYANDKKNGKWYIWDENSTMRYDMTYFEGEKAGTWYMWNEKGELISTKEFAPDPVADK